MSWGTKIALLYGGFVLLIGALIFRSSRENIDLVAADYYEQELRYQGKIDGQSAVLNSGNVPALAVRNEAVVVLLPGDSAEKMTGSVTFYRPNDAKLDREFSLAGCQTLFARDSFVTGLYNVKIAGEAYA